MPQNTLHSASRKKNFKENFAKCRYTDFIIYCMDFKIAQHIMYVFFATIFQTCMFLVIVRVFLKDVNTSGKHSRQVNKCEIMTAVWVFFSFVLLIPKMH